MVTSGQVDQAGTDSLVLQYSFPSASAMYDCGCTGGCLIMRSFLHPLSVRSRTREVSHGDHYTTSAVGV